MTSYWIIYLFLGASEVGYVTVPPQTTCGEFMAEVMPGLRAAYDGDLDAKCVDTGFPRLRPVARPFIEGGQHG
jgi:hypothetical protein